MHPDNSILNLSKKRPTSRLLISTNESTICIDISQIDILIKGNRNRVRIDETAGKLKIIGNDNHVEVRKSWMACEIEGDTNLFVLLQSEFQLKTNQGEGNYIPGFTGVNPAHIANRRVMIQEHFINFRMHSQKINKNTIKKYFNSLKKSTYNSECRECPICYDDIKAGDEVTSLFCFHLFHSACIEACLETTTKCPVCSLDLLRFIQGEIKKGSLVSEGN